MRFTGTHTVAVARQRLWDALYEPLELRDDLPGCTELTSAGAGRYALTLAVDVPCAQGSYRLDVEVVDTTAPARVVLEVRVAGTPGGGSARVEVELTEADGGTEVAYDADAEVGGNLAGVGQRLLAGVVHRCVVDHLDAVDVALGGGSEAAGSADEVVEATDPAGTRLRPSSSDAAGSTRASGGTATASSAAATEAPTEAPTVEVIAPRRSESLVALAVGAVVAATVGYLLGRRSPR